MYLGLNIRYLRIKKGFSQEYIAKKLGYKSFTTVQKWESGVSEPPIRKLKELAELLDADIDEMNSVLLEECDSSSATQAIEMSQRIKERRCLMGYTQEELAEKLGLQKSTIAKYENGRVENMKRNVIANMARTLECSPAYLMGWDDNAQSHTECSQDKLALIETSYGRRAREAFDLYIHLDSDDQGEIRGEMKQMLKAEKYSTKKPKHA